MPLANSPSVPPCTAQVREIYEAAIEATPPADFADGDVRALCVRYAALERKLGEVDRARAIYVHGSSLAGACALRLLCSCATRR